MLNTNACSGSFRVVFTKWRILFSKAMQIPTAVKSTLVLTRSIIWTPSTLNAVRLEKENKTKRPTISVSISEIIRLSRYCQSEPNRFILLAHLVSITASIHSRPDAGYAGTIQVLRSQRQSPLVSCLASLINPTFMQ